MNSHTVHFPPVLIKAITSPGTYALRLAHRDGEWEAQIEIGAHCAYVSGRPGTTPQRAISNLAEDLHHLPMP